ncbi:MAG: CapA family protein [Clostridia bacterium]|nr:CapA family protein [Clostridia bacterium]
MDTKRIKLILCIAIGVMVLAMVIFFLVVVLGGIKNSFEADKPGEATEEPSFATETPGATGIPETEAPTDTPAPTEAPVTYEDVDIVTVGDVIIYYSLWQRALQNGNGEAYDFSELTSLLTDIVEAADVAVFNFEGTCAGENAGGYSHYPSFNAPDSIITAMKNTGFDISLFANNHCYDKGNGGFHRTQQLMKSNGLTVYGTKDTADGSSYGIYEVKGVKIGFLNYTYEYAPDDKNGDSSVKYLNGNKVDQVDRDLIDSFNYTRLGEFYSGVSSRIAEMRSEGADFIMFVIHWGDEYQEEANSTQKAIAQKLCDLGVNALMGMHPHVVQPVETFVSADRSNRMICFYSLGNFISAQNRTTFESKPSYAWLTENEVLSKITVRKYSTGETVIANVSYEPLWSHRLGVSGGTKTTIVPVRLALENDESKNRYGLNESSFGVDHATAARDYIKSQVENGIAAYNEGIVLPH